MRAGRKPTKKEARKKPRPPEEEKPDGLPEKEPPTPQWVLELRRRE